MDRARLRSAAAPLAITVAACIAALIPVSAEPRRPIDATQAGRPPREGPPPAAAEVIALLDGLRPGDTIAGGRVLRIHGPHERMIAVDVERADREITVTIAVRGAFPRDPPRHTARYDLFYNAPRPPARALPAEAVDALLAALAERIAHVEARTPAPPGM